MTKFPLSLETFLSNINLLKNKKKLFKRGVLLWNLYSTFPLKNT